MIRDELGLSKLTGEIANKWIRYVAKDLGEPGKGLEGGWGLMRLPNIDEVGLKSKYEWSKYFNENLWLS
ncbi:hypothetical protein [Oxobacter pfennigii]|uniref:hypothetical protein n=1 Tax=Oxobacter pfennigii TaxID=36849 RepID=UPI00128F43D3|nr:hypothetical protein [Oxobacter pfennigii]